MIFITELIIQVTIFNRFVMTNSLDLSNSNMALIDFDELTETDTHQNAVRVENEQTTDYDFLNRNDFSLMKQNLTYGIKDDEQNRVPLVQYNMKDVVKCLDSLSIKRKRRPMHIAFIGDSTVRQHFLSFLRLIPDNDRAMASQSTKYARFYFHEDRNVTSQLFDNLLISFYWRRLMTVDLMDNFKYWANNPFEPAPDLILLGVTAHHMDPNNVASTLKEYEKLLEGELLPLIKKSMAVHPNQQVIWLNQSPTIDYIGPSADTIKSHRINVELSRRYNRSIRRIFRDTKIVIWDSMNVIVEEYLRSCALTQVLRKDKSRYFSCNDFIHPGYGALSIGTQILVHHLCATV